MKTYKTNSKKYLFNYLEAINEIYVPINEELVFKEIQIFDKTNDKINIVTSHQPNLFYPGTFVKLIYLFIYLKVTLVIN